jgi:hypothetical protein
MGFDVKGFQKAKFTPRTEDVSVPDLKEWFGPKDSPVWKVRGLEGSELGYVNETAARNRNITAILEGIVSPEDPEKIQGIRDLLGMAGNTPEDVARRLEMLVLGSVDPNCDMDLAVKMCRVFPIEFFQLTNKITQLTGQGQIPGKKKSYGPAPQSEEPSTSAT